MKTVHFYGEMAEKFGDKLVLHVNSVPETVRLMEANYPGEFMPFLRDRKFYVLLGDEIENATSMNEEMLPMFVGKKDIHILPYVEGGGGGKNGKGVFTIVLGIALVATGVGLGLAAASAGTSFGAAMGASTGVFGITYGNVAMFGASLIFQGASSLLTHAPKASGLTGTASNPSFLFNGAVNSVQEGGPVPICYGRFMAGSIVVSGGLSFVQLPASGGTTSTTLSTRAALLSVLLK